MGFFLSTSTGEFTGFCALQKTLLDSPVGKFLRGWRMIRDVYPQNAVSSPGGKSWEVGLHLVSTSRGGSTWRKKNDEKNDKVVWWRDLVVLFFFQWFLFHVGKCLSLKILNLVYACRKGRLFSLRWLVIQAINLDDRQLSMSSILAFWSWYVWGFHFSHFRCRIFKISMARFVFFSRCGKIIIKIWGVSKNRGTPKWMVKIMENPIF